MVFHQISLLRQQLRKKVGTLNAVDEFLKDIAGSSSPSDLLPILHALPDSDPSPDEQIKKYSAPKKNDAIQNEYAKPLLLEPE